MSSGAVILLVLVLAAVAVLAALASTAARGRAARQRGGAAPGGLGDRLSSRRERAELAARQRRVDRMGIRPLSAERRSAYERQWGVVQELFIDSPARAVAAAGELVAAVAAERGYDVTDPGQLRADLSVYHGQYLDGSVRAGLTAQRAATAPTEELRQALLGHRALFQDLLSQDVLSGPAAAPPAEARRRTGAWRHLVPSQGRTRNEQGRDEQGRDDERKHEGNGVAVPRP